MFHAQNACGLLQEVYFNLITFYTANIYWFYHYFINSYYTSNSFIYFLYDIVEFANYSLFFVQLFNLFII